jgi:hypothetical protein
MKNEFIKDAHLQEEFDAWKVNELKKCATDPVYFISNYCYVQHPTLGKVKFQLRPYQKRIVEAIKNNQWTILLIGRQAGKSETCAAYAFWYANFHKNKKILLASNKQKGASDLMNRIRFMYESTPDFLRAGVVYYNRGSIEFDNGSNIGSEATTETTGRGRSVSLVLLDELAFVKGRIQEEMWSSLQPTLTTGGSCVIMSTPNGDSELFASLYRGAVADVNGFKPIHVDVDEIPLMGSGFAEGETRASPKWQSQMIEKVGEQKFRQEYKAEFLSSDALLISTLVLNELRKDTPLFVDKGFSFWKEPVPNKTYLVGVDVAEGVSQDFSTIEVFEMETLEQVAEFRSNSINETQLYNAIVWVLKKILSYRDKNNKPPTLYWSFENNSAGAAIATLYYNDEKFPEEAELVSGKAERTGFRTVNKYKIEACRQLKQLIEKKKGGAVIKSEKLIFELKNYVVSGASYAAKYGATDDLISALLIIMRILKKLSEYEPEVFDKIYKSEESFYEEHSNDFEEPIPFVM